MRPSHPGGARQSISAVVARDADHLHQVKLACLALLGAWHAAQRELDELRPDTPAWLVAAARVDAAKNAYTRAFLAVAAQEQVEPDAATGELF